MCEELSADNVTQTPAATHRCRCPSHLTEPAETHFTLTVFSIHEMTDCTLVFGYIFSHIFHHDLFTGGELM